LSLAGLFLLRQAKREKAIRRENRNRQWQQRQRMEQLMAESHSARQLALDELRRQLHRQIPKATKPTDIGAGEPSPAQLSTLEIELAQLRRQADQAQGAASSLAQRIASVPLAEEEWERSQAELQRILQLEQTLQLSREFLEQAQDSVHRDIAPRLAHTLKSWLPKVTGGRYTDAIVDPESLEVRVCGRSRQWRKATLLSHGTREQIYLLLRLALVEHLTREGESAPLLLDEITVHSDQGRTRAILELIQQFTPAHQVLFFSQEVEIAKWAEQHLQAPHDQLIELTGPAAM
ncbi:MAG: ATP-binding protein, partial [Candidatus Dormibacteraceae bacterium]